LLITPLLHDVVQALNISAESKRSLAKMKAGQVQNSNSDSKTLSESELDEDPTHADLGLLGLHQSRCSISLHRTCQVADR